MVKWIEVSLLAVITSKLKVEFLEKEDEPQTPTDSDVQEVAPNAIEYFVSLPPPPV